MIKKILYTLTLFAAIASLAYTHFAAAAFNPNRIIDDGVFSNWTTLSAAQIDAFLNTFPNSCISPNSGFQARVPSGYSPSGGFTYGSFGSAGQVIATASQVYGINPQVLLVTLQKEQSLVAGGTNFCGNGDENKYAAATGYGCPDSGSVYSWTGVSLYKRWGGEHTSTGPTCVNSAVKAGFSQQVIRAAWLLKFGQQRSLGNINWAVITGNWNNSDDPQSCYGGPMTQGYRQVCPSGPTNYYDGYRTIDGQAVHMDTGATAALYWYTPHFHGNQNFQDLFISWFGSVYSGPYTASQDSQSAYPQLDPGQQTTVFIKFQNVGSYGWCDDTAVSTCPAGTQPVHLATAHDLNRASPFSSGWPTSSRPALNFAAVYEADGTTLASNQHMALPGQIAKFSFTLTAPSNLLAGTYREFFQPVVEGVGSGGFSDVSTFFDVTVNPKPNMALYSKSSDPTVYPSGKSQVTLMFVNTGNTVFYDDTTIGQAPAGNYPLHLGTTSPLNRVSNFSGDWPTTSRPALVFTAVYRGDGTTLTDNQHAAGPSQIVKYTFNLSAPEGFTANTYSEAFQPVLDGTGTGGFSGVSGSFNATVPSTAVITYTSVPDPVPLVSNVPGSVSFTIKNSGNAALAGNTKIVTSTSYMQHSSWTSSTVIASTIGSNLSPSQTRNLSFTVLPPNFITSAVTPINISFQDQSNATIPLSQTLINLGVAGATYNSSNDGQSAYPSLTYGQTSTVYFKYKNTGNQYWYDDTGFAGATTGAPQKIHLATNDPLNRNSGFNSGWPTPSRPALTFAAVYEADGTTLASNQHVAQPGQIVTFQFQITPSTGLAPGTYREFFQPIVEGSADGVFPKTWTFIDVTLLTPTYRAAQVSQSAYPTLNPGQQTTGYFNFKNTGIAPWYDDTSISGAPSNAHSIHLGTSHNLNRSSSFSSGWPTPTRPALTFAAVYEADGTTLATNQHVAQPGQIVKFSFTITAPNNMQSGNYREFFQPVAEGTADGAFNDVWTSSVVTVP